MKNFPGSFDTLASITETNARGVNPKCDAPRTATFQPSKAVSQMAAVAAATASSPTPTTASSNNPTSTTGSLQEEEELDDFQREYFRLRDEEWAGALTERSAEEWDTYLADVIVRAGRLWDLMTDIFNEPRQNEDIIHRPPQEKGVRRTGRASKPRNFYDDQA
jgi:hypothetical protein